MKNVVDAVDEIILPFTRTNDAFHKTKSSSNHNSSKKNFFLHIKTSDDT